MPEARPFIRNTMDATGLLKEARIVPVVVLDDLESAVALAATLVEAGLRFVAVIWQFMTPVPASQSEARPGQFR